MPGAPAISTVTLTTSDDQSLTADVALAADSPGALVLCHPHPLYGGTRHDAVVGAVWDAALAAGLSAVRFDFRRAHDQGEAEKLDVLAAVDQLAPRGVVLVGYSFGSYVSLRTDHSCVAGWVGIAPVLHATDHAAGTDSRPTLLLVPRHDQYTPPAVVLERTQSWLSTTVHELVSADHFLGGHHQEVADRTVAFAMAVLDEPRGGA